MRRAVTARFSQAGAWVTLASAHRIKRSASINDTPSPRGQQACPSAMLPTFFDGFVAGGGNQLLPSLVEKADNVFKGIDKWQYEKFARPFLWLQHWVPAGKLSAIRHLVARPSAQEPLCLPVAVSYKVQPSVQGQTSLPAVQNWCAVTSSAKRFQSNILTPSRAFGLRRCFAFLTPIHTSKGLM